MDEDSDVPLVIRHLLVSAVLACHSSTTFTEFLVDQGYEVSTRTVANWLQRTRIWLGLPAPNPGKPSANYRREIEKWRRANGSPSSEEIDAGWVPVHRRTPQIRNHALSEATQKHLDDFRSMLRALEQVTEADVQTCLDLMLKLIEERTEKHRYSCQPEGVPESELPCDNSDQVSQDPPEHTGNEEDFVQETPPVA